MGKKDNKTKISAEDVLDWLSRNGDDTDLMQEVFGNGCENYDDLFGLYTPKAIIRMITDYEERKKMDSSMVKPATICRIFETRDGGKEICVYEKYISDAAVNAGEFMKECRKALSDYAFKAEGHRFVSPTDDDDAGDK